MDGITLIRGTFADNHFVPDESPPPVQGRAEFFVFPEPTVAPSVSEPANGACRVSIFDVLGKAAVLRSGEDIDAQFEAERRAWDED